jgi:hypothetical protein
VKRCLGVSKAAERELNLRTQALWAATHGITSLLTQRPSFSWVSRESVINQVIDSAVQGPSAQLNDGKRSGKIKSQIHASHTPDSARDIQSSS